MRRLLSRRGGPDRRGSGLGLVAAVLVLVVPALWLLASARPAGAAETQPTVSFLGGDLVPLACSAVPDPPSLIVGMGTRVILANFTGADATVDLGTARPIELADGAAISVRFGLGEHTVTMSPKCIRTYGLEPATISVRQAADLPTNPTPGPSGSPTGPASPHATSAGPEPSTSGTAHPLAPGSPGSTPEPNSLSRPAIPAPGGGDQPPAGRGGRGPGSPVAAGPGEVDPGLDIQAATAVRPGNTRPDVRGRRLLALVATICVFGVTSAIIRAIVAQRTTRA